MPMLWKPNGSLDVSTAATDLPQEGQPPSIISGAFQRCKNLILDRAGLARVRNGSVRTQTFALEFLANLIIVMDSVRYVFGGDKIFKDEVLFHGDLTDAQWSGIQYNSFNDTTDQLFVLNGTDTKRITVDTVAEWGITTPAARPVLGVGASTGLTGDYNAQYTYARLSGTTVITESNPSGAQTSPQTLSNEDLEITWTASADPQVTHVRLYRTLTGGSSYFFDQNVAIGTVTIDSDTADADLGGALATNHDRPPLGTLVAGPFYNGVCFIAVGNLLYFCLSKQPEYWPATSFIEVGVPQFPINALVEFSGRVYCLTKAQIWLIQGTGSGSFLPVPLKSLAGSPNGFGAVAVEGQGIYHIGPDGIYLFSGSRDVKITQIAFDVLFSDIAPTNGMSPVLNKAVGTWLVQWENRLYFHYAGGNLLIFNLDTQKATHHKYLSGLTAPFVDQGNDVFYVGDYQNFIRQLEKPEATDDNGEDIAWEAESKDFTLQTRAHFPRHVKYDVDGIATGSVILDGVVHQTHALTKPRNIRRRLVKPGNGARLSVRVSGSVGPVKGTLVVSGAAEGTPTTTVIQTDLLEDVDDRFIGFFFVMSSGGELGEVRKIKDYLGVSGTVILEEALSGAPSSGETLDIFNAQPSSSGIIYGVEFE